MSVDRTTCVPLDRRYTDLHSWLTLPTNQRSGDRPLRLGITEAAVEGIRIISVELPRIGTALDAGEPCALIWSNPLSAMPVYAPITGLVTAVNAEVREDPGIVARDPFHSGWLFAVLPAPESSTSGLLTASDYAVLLGVAANPSKSRG